MGRGLFFLSVFFLFCGNCFAQWYENGDNQREEAKEKCTKKEDGLYYITGEDNPFSGIIFKKDGKGRLQLKVEILKGKFHGVRREFYTHGHGRGKSESYWKDGKKNWVSRTWHKNGNLRTEKHWKVGKLHGVSREWHENGKVKNMTFYREGLRFGPSKSYDEKGELVSAMDTRIGSK
ncbi:toxin-antitoxin system YwqK family antitoxin [Candidatus Riflebacteria bacterium]